MDQPDGTDPGIEDAGDEAPAEGSDRPVEQDEPTLAPGDSDLADAWWAQ